MIVTLVQTKKCVAYTPFATQSEGGALCIMRSIAWEKGCIHFSHCGVGAAGVWEHLWCLRGLAKTGGAFVITLL
jgi:hypothetical protein